MITPRVKYLQLLLVEYYDILKIYPKSKYWKGEYKNVLNELDEEMQQLPFPFSND